MCDAFLINHNYVERNLNYYSNRACDSLISFTISFFVPWSLEVYQLRNLLLWRYFIYVLEPTKLAAKTDDLELAAGRNRLHE